MADGPLTNFANLRGRTDANGYLIVTINGGTILAADGTQALPGIAFANDPDTGFWRSASNTMNWITGGGILLTGSANISIGTGVHLLWTTDNGTDLGASGATRPRTGYFGTSVVTPLIAVTTATLSSKITTYNGVVTAGQGVQSIYAAGSVVAQTTVAASICTYTTPTSDGDYEVGGNVLVTASGTHSFSLNCSYTDEGGSARTLIIPVAQLAGAFAANGLITNVTGVGPYESAGMHIRCKQTTAITIGLSAGTFTSVTYNARGVIRQLQ